MKESILIEELKSCVRDWGDDFDIDVEQEDCHKEHTYFSVVVTHKLLSGEYEFAARVGFGDSCQMELSEGDWRTLNMGNLFARMWFETATVRPDRQPRRTAKRA